MGTKLFCVACSFAHCLFPHALARHVTRLEEDSAFLARESDCYGMHYGGRDPAEASGLQLCTCRAAATILKY
eukprot:4587334-Amphidinium_carterae.1